MTTDEGVPGMFIRIADIAPPAMPPMYTPINVPIAVTSLIEKVRGIIRATPIVALNPGSAPKMRPTATPSNTQSRPVGLVNTLTIPAITVSNVIFKSS